MASRKHRLLTRSDFDGLVCAVLLKELDLIDEIKFVHPKDVQDGKIDVSDRDILTNLPYVDSCHLCFDHHDSETIRTEGRTAENQVLEPGAASAARVLYNHFGGADRFPNVCPTMMEAVDRADSAKFTREEVLHPEGWVLLSFIMDARTGLGRFRDFNVSNYDLMMKLIDFCRDHTIDEILKLPDVSERVELYRAHEDKMKGQVVCCSNVYENVVVLDLRREETIYCGNRFIVYALFPGCNVSIHVLWGLKKQNTVLAIGKSVFDRGCPTDIGALALEYGGGGHRAAATCQIPNADADRILAEIVDRLQAEDAAAPKEPGTRRSSCAA